MAGRTFQSAQEIAAVLSDHDALHPEERATFAKQLAALLQPKDSTPCPACAATTARLAKMEKLIRLIGGAVVEANKDEAGT